MPSIPSLPNRLSSLCILAAFPISAAASTLQVGPGKPYAKPCLAIAAAKAGDVIEVAGGDYPGDTCAWSTDNLTLRGVGGLAKIDLAGVSPAQKKGIFTIAAANATIENFEFSHAAISAADGNNGAGIRHQGLNLTVRGCSFHDNQNGILGSPSTPGTGTVLIENSEFAHNGAGDGYSHNMYLGNYAEFTLRFSYSHHGKVGHLVKTRAKSNFILSNRLTDETGTASYELEMPNGGLSVVLGNIIEQSMTTGNPALLSYGAEGLGAGYDGHLYVVNNTFLNRKGSGTFVVDATSTPALLQNNIFWNGGSVSTQASAMKVTNFDSSAGDPKFVDLAAYNLRLLEGSPCIDQGSNPGAAGAQSLTPMAQYVHPRSSNPRGLGGSAIDIGAYEFANPGASDAGPGPGDDAGQMVVSPADAGAGDSGKNDDGGVQGPLDGGGVGPSGCGCSGSDSSANSMVGVVPLVLLGVWSIGRGARRAATCKRRIR